MLSLQNNKKMVSLESLLMSHPSDVRFIRCIFLYNLGKIHHCNLLPDLGCKSFSLETMDCNCCSLLVIISISFIASSSTFSSLVSVRASNLSSREVTRLMEDLSPLARQDCWNFLTCWMTSDVRSIRWRPMSTCYKIVETIHYQTYKQYKILFFLNKLFILLKKLDIKTNCWILLK